MLSTICFTRQYVYEIILLANGLHHSYLFLIFKTKKNQIKNYSVVAWYANIDITQWIIRVDETNNWYVDIRCFGYWLMVSNWVSDDDQSRLFECLLNLIGKWTWCETASDWCSTFKKITKKFNKILKKYFDSKKRKKIINMYRWLSQYKLLQFKMFNLYS